MSWHICKKCDWKFDPDEYDNCPMCGKPSPSGPDMVRQWNSTLKANPNKKPKRSPIKPKKRDPRLKEAMMKRAETEIKEARAEGRAIRCGNCGLKIREIKFENISHRETRGSHPEKSFDQENMDFLCGPTDYWGKKDTSCHTLWERGKIDEFNAKKGKHL